MFSFKFLYSIDVTDIHSFLFNIVNSIVRILWFYVSSFFTSLEKFCSSYIQKNKQWAMLHMFWHVWNRISDDLSACRMVMKHCLCWQIKGQIDSAHRFSSWLGDTEITVWILQLNHSTYSEWGRFEIIGKPCLTMPDKCFFAMDVFRNACQIRKALQ